MQNRETLFERLDRVAKKCAADSENAHRQFAREFTLGETAMDRAAKEIEERRLLRLDVLSMIG